MSQIGYHRNPAWATCDVDRREIMQGFEGKQDYVKLIRSVTGSQCLLLFVLVGLSSL